MNENGWYLTNLNLDNFVYCHDRESKALMIGFGKAKSKKNNNDDIRNLAKILRTILEDDIKDEKISTILYAMEHRGWNEVEKLTHHYILQKEYQMISS